MTERSPGSRPSTPRDRFRRRRLRVLTACAVIVLELLGVGYLLAAPRHLASVRLLDVSVGWWIALTAHLVGLAVLALGPGRRVSKRSG